MPNLHDSQQNFDGPAWKRVCELVSKYSENNADAFEPSAYTLASEFMELITLPPDIGTLNKVSNLRLYGSHLQRIPPEIGRMSMLADLDIDTSYSLHWLPYEIMRCSKLARSRMSTRALYGNKKTRLPFPRLSKPIETATPTSCSVCDRPFGQVAPKLYWTTQRIGTDFAPLLIHACSDECVAHVPDAPSGFHQRPHRGGGGVGMPHS